MSDKCAFFIWIVLRHRVPSKYDEIVRRYCGYCSLSKLRFMRTDHRLISCISKFIDSAVQQTGQSVDSDHAIAYSHSGLSNEIAG